LVIIFFSFLVKSQRGSQVSFVVEMYIFDLKMTVTVNIPRKVKIKK